MSCQQTPMAYDIMKGYLATKKTCIEDADIDASCPPFNLRKTPEWMKIQNNMLRQNCVVFGPKIQAAAVAVLKQLDPKLMKNLAPYVTLKWKVDAFVQSKMKKLGPLFAVLEKRGLKEAAAHMADFSLRFQEVNMPAEAQWSDWLDFLKECKIPENWDSCTHFDHVLQLFGVPQDQVADILDTKHIEFGQEVTMRDYAVRWLSKALCGFSCSIVTDLVNLIASIMSVDSPTVESDVVDMINHLVTDIEKLRRLSTTIQDLGPQAINSVVISDKYRRPSVIMIDLEKDDLFAWWLILSITPREPDVLVQLPCDEVFDPLEVICKKFGNNVKVFRDPNSINGPALKNLFQL